MAYNTTVYRDDTEGWILAVTLLGIVAVIVLTASATICLGGLAVLLFGLLAYSSTRDRHRALLAHATPVTPESAPQLARLVEDARLRLQAEPVQTFVVRQNTLNAYTFGITRPRVVVLYSGLLQVMDADELQFIIGHELGHVRLGHVWLNTLVGGLAGMPQPIGAFFVITLAFRWWNRACEFSCDRAGMLACNNPQKAMSALAKLLAVQAGARTPGDIQRALVAAEAESDDWVERAGQLFATHPIIVERIRALQRYARSREYARVQAGMNGNLGQAAPEPPRG